MTNWIPFITYQLAMGSSAHMRDWAMRVARREKTEGKDASDYVRHARLQNHHFVRYHRLMMEAWKEVDR